LNLAGGENVFADLETGYAEVSVEAIAVREIDVFVVADYGPNYTYAPSAQERAEFLIKTFPNSAAAKNRRYVLIPYQYINPSIQNALGVKTLAEGFFPEAFQ
jgi:iron complex transport system substrate-binding protein